MNTAISDTLIPPCGGALVDLVVTPEEREAIIADAQALPSIQIGARALCDLELISTGAFSPLDRFMGKEDHQRVLDECRLAGGHLFPIPVTLPVEPGPEIALDRTLGLRNANNELVAVLTIEEAYEWDRAEVARKAFGTEDSRHPMVAEMTRWGPVNLSGSLRVIQPSKHFDFQDLRLTPAQTRARLAEIGHPDVVAFQTHNPLHRVHEELTRRAIERLDAVLLLHPVVGLPQPGDVDRYARVRTYRQLARHHAPDDRILLSLLPLATRMAGPREALWHALIRRNFGANHLIVGHDHAGAGEDSQGKPFYGPYDAQERVTRHREELGVEVVPFQRLVYLPDEDRYEEVDRIPRGTRTASISGTQVREEYLDKGRTLPEWFTRPPVARILAAAYPARHRQGFCIWFTGLSGSGKSTTAEILAVRLAEHGRRVSLLDGDVVRTHLSKGLGFSREDRDTNIRRIGYVAAEIARHGGAVICAAVSPYRATRSAVRAMIGEGRFIEVFVDTPLAVCEARDTKGLYASARRGELKQFTGIDDPYEPPEHAELTMDTVSATPEANARRILDALIDRGFVRADEAVSAG